MDLEPLFTLVILAASAVAAIHDRLTSSRRASAPRNVLRKQPFARIRDMVAGQPTKIRGAVRSAGATLRAPLSGRECVYYHVVVEERVPAKGTNWKAIVAAGDAVDFLVEDATGRARVRGAEITLLREVEANYISYSHQAKPELEALLRKHGQTAHDRHLRWRERVLELGKEVVVLGTAGWETDPESAAARTIYRDAPTRPVIFAMPQGGVLASDEPKLIRGT
jgi:hypothetical protein